jgi:biopolymer transport protein ExbD
VAVIVRAHKDLAVQKLMNVMDAVQRAQIKRVGVVTTPEQP